ncbi:MAG: cobyrinate a,c-diamide synthase [Chloroflexota bacterium]|nr:cobyrinate a,c-diamide synthase [Chloroflexota bacterium]
MTTVTIKHMLPRLAVAGTHSGVGKTSVVLGLIAALRRLGLAVAPFKVGPDFVDPAFHAYAAGRPSRALDSWLLSPAELDRTLMRASSGADLALIEGMMGLYDGRAATTDEASTAAVAKLLNAPVILVTDVSAAARSAAATVLGFRELDPAVHLVGVVANGVGSPGHLELVREAIGQGTGLPVVGSLPREVSLTLPERHLGLTLPGEVPGLDEVVERLGALVAERFDLAVIQAMAAAAPPLAVSPLSPSWPTGERTRIAVAQDAAFAFYYPENLEILAELGAEVVPFSPLRDPGLPPGTTGVYLGGGYPELHATALAANRRLLAALRGAAAAGMPIYAECGGLMYLTRGLREPGGLRHRWVGAVPAWTKMDGTRSRIAYVAGIIGHDSALGPAGTPLRGHVFHRSALDRPLPTEACAFHLTEPTDAAEGYARGNLVASYVHLHFGAVPDLAAHWLDRCWPWHSGKRTPPDPDAPPRPADS